jgi:hypothetical protein
VVGSSDPLAILLVFGVEGGSGMLTCSIVCRAFYLL